MVPAQMAGVARPHYDEPASYWQAAVSPPTLSAELPRTADVAVVGGGIVGTATAYWLARAGARTVLIERHVPAYGATGRNAGFVTVGPAEGYSAAIRRLGHAAAHSVYQLTVENRERLREVLSAEEIACDYREPGSLGLALGPDQHAAASLTVESIRADGFSAVLLDRQEVEELAGTALAHEVTGGIFLPGCGLLHSTRFVYGLLVAAQRHGAQAVQANVMRITDETSGVAVQTIAGTLRVAAVVVAANAWTGDLFPVFARLVTPVRGQMLAYEPVAPTFKTGMAAALTPTGEYCQQTLDGTIVVGGCRAHAPGNDVGVREGRPTDEVQSALETVLPRLFPELGGLRVVQRWAGLMAFTPDYLPIAGRVPETTNVWVAGGFCGHGMPFGLRIGQLLAEAALTGVTPQPLVPLRSDRPTLASISS